MFCRYFNFHYRLLNFGRMAYVHDVRQKTYMMYNLRMEVPITEFRRNLFNLANKALDGAEVWVRHKGRRFRIVPENGPADKLSRVTPMDIIPAGVDLEDDSWKVEMMQKWERNWDRQLEAISSPPRKASAVKRVKARPTRRKA